MQRTSPSLEATLYDDNSQSTRSNGSMNCDAVQRKALKHERTIVSTTAGGQPHKRQCVDGGVLFSTDNPAQILYPKSVTEEQEVFALGFEVALNEFRKSQASGSFLPTSLTSQVSTHAHQAPQPITNASMTSQLSQHANQAKQRSGNASMTSQDLKPATEAMYRNANASLTSQILPPAAEVAQHIGNDISNSQQYQGFPSIYAHTHESFQHPVYSAIEFSSQNVPPGYGSRVRTLREEPQIVPSLGCTPPISPINMNYQELAKLERKRERNRDAARKCRNKKMEQIGRLESRVQELTDQNVLLAQTAAGLRRQLGALRQEMHEHTSHGCVVFPACQPDYEHVSTSQIHSGVSLAKHVSYSSLLFVDSKEEDLV